MILTVTVISKDGDTQFIRKLGTPKVGSQFITAYRFKDCELLLTVEADGPEVEQILKKLEELNN